MDAGSTSSSGECNPNAANAPVTITLISSDEDDAVPGTSADAVPGISVENPIIVDTFSNEDR